MTRLENQVGEFISTTLTEISSLTAKMNKLERIIKNNFSSLKEGPSSSSIYSPQAPKATHAGARSTHSAVSHQAAPILLTDIEEVKTDEDDT